MLEMGITVKPPLSSLTVIYQYYSGKSASSNVLYLRRRLFSLSKNLGSILFLGEVDVIIRTSAEKTPSSGVGQSVEGDAVQSRISGLVDRTQPMYSTWPSIGRRRFDASRAEQTLSTHRHGRRVSSCAPRRRKETPAGDGKRSRGARYGSLRVAEEVGAPAAVHRCKSNEHSLFARKCRNRSVRCPPSDDYLI